MARGIPARLSTRRTCGGTLRATEIRFSRRPPACTDSVALRGLRGKNLSPTPTSNAITWSVAPGAGSRPSSSAAQRLREWTRRLAALRCGPQWLCASRRSPLRKSRRTGVHPTAIAGPKSPGSGPGTSARPWRLGNMPLAFSPHCGAGRMTVFKIFLCCARRSCPFTQLPSGRILPP